METKLTVLWKAQTEGAIWGTAAVSDGSVFVGSDDGNLYAVDAQSGGIQWKFATEGFVRSRPALLGGRIFVASDDGYLYAVDTKTGEQAWRTDIGNRMPAEERYDISDSPSPTGYDYLQSSPVVEGERVYIGSLDGKVYALDAGTGAVLWTFQTGAKVRATPAVEDDVVYIGSWDMNVYALNAEDGVPIWSTPIGGQIQSTALVADGMVYCASRKASVVALDVKTGALLWEHRYGNNMWVESSPRLAGDIVYIGSSGTKFVLGLNDKTGTPHALYMSKAFHWSTPLILDNMLYIGGTSPSPDTFGGLYALQLTDGMLPAVSDPGGVQILAVDQNLETSGIWGGVSASPITANGVIYFGGLDGKLYGVSPAP